jgi:hypothetical protein
MSMGHQIEPGDSGTTPVEQTDSSEELAEAAKGMAEVADHVRALRDGMRSLRDGIQAQATGPAGDPGAAQPPMVDELREAATALEASAQHLSRAVELLTPHLASVAAGPEPDRAWPLPDGLRALISSLHAAGWSDEEVALYLRRELDVPDVPAAVARAPDRPR